MTIRTKSICIISSILILMVVSIYVVNRFILLEGYLGIEREDILKNVSQVSNQLSGELERLKSVCNDWAPWDDTYQFVQDINEEYISNNLMDYTIVNLKINFMIFLSTEGKAVYCKELDLATKQSVACSKELESLAIQHPTLLRNDKGNQPFGGFYLMNGKILLLAASPILTSKFDGPVKGTLIIGIYFDQERLKEMAEKLKLSLKVTPVVDPGTVSGLDAVTTEQLRQMKAVVVARDTKVKAVCQFEDPENSPVFTMDILKNRDIFNQGKKSLDLFLISLCVIGIVFFMTTLLFFEKAILKHIAVLHQDVRDIKSGGNEDRRISVQGNDEISFLSKEINAMLDTLWEGRKRYQALFDFASDGILLLENNKIIDCNFKAVQLFGIARDEIVGRDLSGLSPEEQPSGETSETAIQKMIDKGVRTESILFEWVFARQDGRKIESEVNLTGIELPMGYHLQAIIRDITERKKTLKMVVQTEKMVSIGALAAGMAHEINNPLSGMMQNAQVIQGRLLKEMPVNVEAAEAAGTSLETIRHYVKGRRIDELLSSINQAGEQAAKIVKNLLQFARPGEGKYTLCDLPALMDRTLELARSDYNLRKTCNYNAIEILKDYQEDMPRLECDETRLQQVFLNMIKNAVQAVSGAASPQRKPMITLKLVMENAHARIEIGDNGPGMDEVKRKRVFEPFYTTQQIGQGTGLGLSTAFFIIVNDFGGSVKVESEPGSGTNFIIKLPFASNS